MNRVIPAGKGRVSPLTTHHSPRPLLLLAGCVWVANTGVHAQPLPFTPGRDVAFEQKLDERVPADIALLDEQGRQVALGDYFGDTPLALMLVQYRCPMLCNVMLEGCVRSLKALSFDPGREFHVLVVSFDAREDWRLAQQSRRSVLARYGRPGTEGGWHFLTGERGELDRLTAAVGFRYYYDAGHDRYAHPAGLVVLTPGGRISRYFPGIDPPPRDLRLGLVEASRGLIGALSDRMLLLCYEYDPTTGRYGLAVMTALRVGGVLTIITLAGGIVLLLRRERRKQTAADQLLQTSDER